MLCFSSCRTTQKQANLGIFDEIYIPVYPSAVKDGKEVCEYKKTAVIDGEVYDDVYIVPFWYMLQLALYGSENEAAWRQVFERLK